MKNRKTHIKFLSLILTIVMALSTAMVFAEGVEPSEAIDPAAPLMSTESEAAEDAPSADTPSADTPASDNQDIPDQNTDGNQNEDGQSGEETPAPVAPTVTVEPTEASIVVGDTVELKATVVPEGEYAIKWESSDSAIATVSEAGVVTGIAAGNATITATVEGAENPASCSVTVAEKTFTTEAPVLKADKKYSSKAYEGSKDNGYKLNWTQSDKTGVTGYQIILNGSEVVDTVGVDVKSYEVLVPSGTNKYTVKALGSSDDEFIDSNEVSIKISGVITETHAYTWYCTTKKKVKAGGVTIPKGTKMKAVGRYPAKIKKFRYPTKVQVIYKGKKVWVPYGSLKGGVKATVNVKKDYSRSLKEYMVNNAAFSQGTNESSKIRGKEITSKDNHLVWACLYTQRAYTFEKKSGKWELIHTDRITTGKFSHPTRSSETSGIYTVKKKIKGKVWMVQENGKRYYFTNASYITSGVSFHTGTWWASGKVRGTIKKNGQPGTYGCIRMKTAGAKYIFAHTQLKKTGAIVTRFD